VQARGYHILIFMAENSTQSVSKVVEELLDYQVDGIITASVDVTGDLAKRCANAGIPIVLFNRGQDEAHLSEVTSDNLAGGRSVAKFLVAGGHKRIVHIAGWQGSSTGRDRALGFVDALKELGVHNITQIDGMYKRDVAAQAARDLFRGPKSPDAVFVGNDHMAFAVLDVLRLELGLSVPNDVSVVGYDDVPLAAWPSFSLTTVRQPLDHMVRTTVDLLLDTIENMARTPAKIRISGPLVLRQSSRIPKGGWPLHQV
jgi:DNA-binding LacI/PurR family transcriptional regulator